MGAIAIASLPVSAVFADAGFKLLDPKDTGVGFENVLSDRDGALNRVLLNGSGVAAADIDGDGLTDLYFCGLGSANVLYKNLGGFKFEDVTADAGVDCDFEFCRAAAFADIDGDGAPDLLVGTNGAGVKTFLNDGRGNFTDITYRSGLSSLRASVALALADVDGDGDLDLYVGNNRAKDFRDSGEVTLMKKRDGTIFVPEEKKIASSWIGTERSSNTESLISSI